MLLDCYGPTPRGAMDVATVAHYAGVSPSTVWRWLSQSPDGSDVP
jgi:predicted DNA-binding transcriptional regulator AlpA